MSHYNKGRVNFTEGSNIVTGDGTQEFLSRISAGHILTRIDSNVAYEVGNVTSNNQFELTEGYVGDTELLAPYSITTSKTPVLGIPYMERRDLDTHVIFKRAMLRVESLVQSGGVLNIPNQAIPFATAVGVMGADAGNLNWNNTSKTLNVNNVQMVGALNLSGEGTANLHPATTRHVNQLGSPVKLYSLRGAITGLNLPYHGGRIGSRGTTIIADGSVALTDASTNYVEITPTTGAVTANTVGFTLGRYPLYRVTTAAGQITGVDDYRQYNPHFDRGIPTEVNVKDPRFGARGDGGGDDTAAIQAAIQYFGTGAAYIYLPKGTYKVTSTLYAALAASHVHIRGAGPTATMIRFEPVVDGICLNFGSDSVAYTHCSLKDLSFWSPDQLHRKIAIYIRDISVFEMSNVHVFGSYDRGRTNYWSGGPAGAADSIGIVIDGHECMDFKGLNIVADRPFHIGKTTDAGVPAAGSHWADHYNFHNIYAIAYNNPVWAVGDTANNCSYMSWTGYQAWVGGTIGFKMAITSAVQVAFGFFFENVRTEQHEDANAYSFDVSHNISVQQFKMENCRMDLYRNAIKLRNVVNVELNGVVYSPVTPTKVFIDSIAVNQTYALRIRNALLAQCAYTLTNYRQTRGSNKGLTAHTLPQDSDWVYNSASMATWPQMGSGEVKQQTFVGNLAAGGLLNLESGLNQSARLTIARVIARGVGYDEGGTVGLTINASILMGGTANFKASNVAGNVCAFKNGNTFHLYNRLAVAIDYMVVLDATGVGAAS